MKIKNNQLKDAGYESVANIAILLIAFFFAYFTWGGLGTDHSVNHNLADILAEILGIIFILPQVVIQLTLSPEQKDLKTIFKSSISWYLLFYILAIIVLSYDFIYDWVHSEKWASIICLAFFVSALFQIAPYLFFFIRKHSLSTKINRLIQQILKKAKKLAKCATESPDEGKIKKFRESLIADINDLKKNLLLYGNENDKVVRLGGKFLDDLIKKLYEYNNKEIDDLLLRTIEMIGNVGVRIARQENSAILAESLKEAALYILNNNHFPNEKSFSERMTKFLLPMIVKITDMALINPDRVSVESILNCIEFMDEIIKKAIRYKTVDDNGQEVIKPKEIEYPNIVFQLKRIGEFSLIQNYDYATNELFNCIKRMWQLSFKYLRPEFSPILKISEALVDLGRLSAKKENERYVFEAFSNLEEIIKQVRKNPVFDLEYCIGCYMQLVSAVFHNMYLLEDWLCVKMKNLERNANIKLSDFFESSERIISYKSEVERRLFVGSLEDFLRDCLGISDDEEPEEEKE